jgi:ligand-binding sensor domain-containing protein/two-component sensor histidine kinase
MGIVTLVERNGCELWAGGQNGLYRWDGSRWNAVYTGEGLYPPGINALIVDRDGAIWAATEGGGLLCFRERKIKIIRLPTGREQQSFTALYQASDGFLYAGVAGQGLWRKQLGGAFSNVPLPNLTSQATVMSLVEDPTRTLLVGALGHHLLRVDSAFQTQPIYPGPKVPFMDSGVRALLKVKESIWVGTQRGVMVYTPETGLVWPWRQPSHTINALAISADGSTVYAASETEGVLAFSADSKRTWMRINKGLPNMCVESLLVTANGKLWAGGIFGLAFYDAGQWHCYADPLLTEGMRVVQILEDNMRILWLGTNKGILRVTPPDTHATSPRTSSKPSLLLGIEDGLDDITCTGGFSPVGLKQKDGTLLFPTQNGLACLDPTQRFLNLDPGIPIVDEIDCDGHPCWRRPVMPIPPLHAVPAVRLPTGTRKITIRWLNTYTRYNSAVQFRVQLKGTQTQEIMLTQKREASFEHLHPGRYAFTLAHANQTIPLPEQSLIQFTLPPHWWQRDSVRFGLIVLLLLCVGGLGWWMARVRSKHLRKTDLLRLRIARDLHDEIGANLGGIALLLDMASTGSGDQEAFEKIGMIVRQSIATLKDLVWMIDPVHDNTSDLVSRMRESSDMLLASLPHTFDGTGIQNDERTIATTVRRNILPIFKEALHNIRRHAQAKQVHIALTIHQSTLVLTIEDDGIGISESAPDHGHGLRNMRRRAQEMNALLDFEKPSQGGTRLRLTIPMTKD